jgi:RES domain-containing protein
MVFDRETIEALECLQAAPWTGVVFRHMWAEFEPERANTRGARWNPPGCAAIYASLDRETCLAEANYQLNLQPVRIRAKRSIYRIRIVLSKVLDLSDWQTLIKLGLDQDRFLSDKYEEIQKIGGAAEWMKHDGIFVPSARAVGRNLVIFPNQQEIESYKFEVLEREELEGDLF